MVQAFSGYHALPQSPMEPPRTRPWWMVLQVRPSASLDEIKRAYRTLALKHHPDVNGDSQRMSEINHAWEQAQLELSQRNSYVW